MLAWVLGYDLLVHCEYLCLHPLTFMAMPCLYIFVEFWVDADHLVEFFYEFLAGGRIRKAAEYEKHQCMVQLIPAIKAKYPG